MGEALTESKGCASTLLFQLWLLFLRQAVGSRQDTAPQVGDVVQVSEELGSSSLEAEVSLSAQNRLRVQTESVRALSGVETCYFCLSTLFDCDSLRPYSNDWVYLTPTRRQRSSSLGTISKKVSAFLFASSHSPLIQSFLLEHSPEE